MNQQGPANQQFRGLAAFSNQVPQTRGGGLGPGRLQNAKMVTNPGWGYSVQNGGPGVLPQGRVQGTSFAATIGGSQANTPLDPSEFPSLSGATQPPFQNPNQAAWANTRGGLPNPSQRLQQSQSSRPGSRQQQSSLQNQDQAQQNLEDAFFLSNGNNDDPRQRGQGGGQPNPSMQARQNNQTPGDQRQVADKIRDTFSKTPPDEARRSSQPGGEEAGEENGGPPQAKAAAIDRYGVQGLLDSIKADAQDGTGLSIGQDLTTLGLDLNSSDALNPTFAGPFSQVPSKPLQPDFVLPACYTVVNTHPIEEKMTSLSDETLFWIFYNMPRDIMQELAAIELTSRNWRFHKILGVWLTKETGITEPQQIAHNIEQGRYCVFNYRSWQKEPQQMMLRYSDLDSHITDGVPGGIP